jgi:hypothetical protein
MEFFSKWHTTFCCKQLKIIYCFNSTKSGPGYAYKENFKTVKLYSPLCYIDTSMVNYS